MIYLTHSLSTSDPLYGSAELSRRIDATGQLTLVPADGLKCTSPNELAGLSFSGTSSVDAADDAKHPYSLLYDMDFQRMMCFMFPCAVTNPSGVSVSKSAVEAWQRRPYVFTGVNGKTPLLSRFCKSQTMSTGVFAREAVRFLVTDAAARASYAFFHRGGSAYSTRA